MTREDRAFRLRWEEYKVIQDKIDRIGDFRFRLRSWVITLIAAAAGAARFAKLPPEVFFLGLVVILAFYRLEAVQLRWERALGNRAGVLEAELRDSYGAPGIVNALALARNLARHRRILGPFLLADSWVFYGLMCAISVVGLGLSVDLRQVTEVMRTAIAVVVIWVKTIPGY